MRRQTGEIDSEQEDTTMRKHLVFAVTLVTMLALATPVGAAKDKPGKPEPDVDFKTCADLGWESEQGILVFGTDDGCEDVRSSPGATFTFTFPKDVSLHNNLVLGIRNSYPGDWCDGWWTVGSGSAEYTNALTLRDITPGLVVTLVVDDGIIDGSCTSDDGIVHWNDDSSDWVVTAAGRIPGFKGSINIGLEITP
jgi:hypothetical protein